IAHHRTRKLGGAAAIALFLAVFPANINMAYQWRKKPWPLKAVAYGRLPLQAVLIKQGWNVMKVADAEKPDAEAGAQADAAAANH
ncbi:MAG: hypothetical protein KHW47_08895, partial [Actinotignum schaalii]|nr:hypothetical protein [Actinotignum schaalii]